MNQTRATAVKRSGALAVEHICRVPAAFVLLLPAYWLLVPGSLGLIGLTELVGQESSAGFEDVATMLFTIIAIAGGIVVGVSLWTSLGWVERRWPSRLPG